jgi:O-antigen ligase
VVQSHSSASYERLVYALLFLFPIAGNSVRSWTGIIFGLLFLAAILSLLQLRNELTIQERTLFAIVFAIFFITVISNFANGWGYPQTKGLGVYLRWLLFIPIYWFIREFKEGFFWLANGTILASFLLSTQSIIDVYILHSDRSYGAYDSPGLVGIQSLVFVITLIGAIRVFSKSRSLMCLYGLGCIAALVSLVLSGSRSTYFLLVLLVPCVIFILFKLKNALLVLSFVTVCVAVFNFNNDFVANRVQSGLKEAQDYFSTSSPASISHGSVGTRLEMWKASILIANENPFLGVGWRNFSLSTKPFVDQGLVSASVSHHPHPHNMYLEFLVTTGLCGLLLVTVLFLYVIWVARQSATKAPIAARLLLVFILAFIFNGINEGGALAYGNALSFFLVYLGVFFSMTQTQSMLKSPRRANH